MQCPTCDREVGGTRCACGWISSVPSVQATTPEPKGNEAVTGRRWAFCEWTSREGRCSAPTGTLGMHANEMAAPRLCAYHRDRERVSLADLRMTERQYFDDWVRQFPAGTAYQPFPGIWDKDPDVLWALLRGQVPFADVAGTLLGRTENRAKLQHDLTQSTAEVA